MWRRVSRLSLSVLRGPRPFSSLEAEFKQRIELAVAGKGYRGLLMPQIQAPSPRDVFANSDTPLSHLKMFGFDYDYTLAHYEPSLLSTIYAMASKHMVQNLGYPEQLVQLCAFDPKFAIRGLHFDSKTGLLLKMDQFNKVQPGSVYLGRIPLKVEEILRYYGGMRASVQYVKVRVF